MSLWFLIILINLSSLLHCKGIQLNSIPGQSKEMDIGNLLEQIMFPYHEEISTIKNHIRDLELEQQLWNNFKEAVVQFDQINKFMVGHESPFRSVTSINSHPDLLEVKVQRTAYPGKYEVSVLQLAKPHSFSSLGIDPNMNISSGVFNVTIGEQTHTIDFRGGSLDDLVQSLKNELDGKIRIKTVTASQNKKILTMSSLEEGDDSIITFGGNLQPLKDIKLLDKNKNILREIMWSNNLKHNSLRQNVDESIEDEIFLIFDVTLDPNIAPMANKKDIQLNSLPYSSLGMITNSVFSIPGSKPLLDDTDAFSPIQKESDQDVIILTFNDMSEKRFDLTEQSYAIPLKDHIGKQLKTIQLNTYNKKLNVSDTLVISKNNAGDILAPAQEISRGQNAKILLDGIEIDRPSNAFSNVIPGVVLSLLKAEPETNININIRHNLEMIEDTIIEWVKAYNVIMEEIFLLATIPIKKIGKLKPLHEREKEGDNLKEGALYGNFNIRAYKDRLRQLVGIPHSRIEGNLSLFDQIGIYVNRKNSIHTDPQVLQKGTLTLNTAELNDALNNKFEQVYHLFAHDTNGDNIADEGASILAINIDKLMLGESGYIDRNDIVMMDKIRELNKKITKKEEDIERIEIKERKALLEMNKAIAESKALSESLKQRM